MFAFARKANGTSNVYNYIPILLFTLVFGFRYSVGVDWENYREIYEVGGREGRRQYQATC